jgi:hypothetical protein
MEEMEEKGSSAEWCRRWGGGGAVLRRRYYGSPYHNFHWWYWRYSSFTYGGAGGKEVTIITQEQLPLLDMVVVVVVVKRNGHFGGSVEMARMAHNYYFHLPKYTNRFKSNLSCLCNHNYFVLPIWKRHGRSFRYSNTNPTSLLQV